MRASIVGPYGALPWLGLGLEDMDNGVFAWKHVVIAHWHTNATQVVFHMDAWEAVIRRLLRGWESHTSSSKARILRTYERLRRLSLIAKSLSKRNRAREISLIWILGCSAGEESWGWGSGVRSVKRVGAGEVVRHGVRGADSF